MPTKRILQSEGIVNIIVSITGPSESESRSPGICSEQEAQLQPLPAHPHFGIIPIVEIDESLRCAGDDGPAVGENERLEPDLVALAICGATRHFFSMMWLLPYEVT